MDTQRNPESNAPDTYAGPTTSPEGYAYRFHVRGGVKAQGEDPGKSYVLTGPDGKPQVGYLYAGQQFGSVAEIAEHKAELGRQGYTTAHADAPVDVPGVGFPLMSKAEADAALKAFDAAKSDRDRFARLTPRMVQALQSRGWRMAGIDATVRANGGAIEKAAPAAQNEAGEAKAAPATAAPAASSNAAPTAA